LLCPLPDLAQESGVVDRDDGLIREGLQHRDLPGREGTNLEPPDHESADGLAIVQERYGEPGPVPVPAV
jgi:hypothetical protein